MRWWWGVVTSAGVSCAGGFPVEVSEQPLRARMAATTAATRNRDIGYSRGYASMDRSDTSTVAGAERATR